MTKQVTIMNALGKDSKGKNPHSFRPDYSTSIFRGYLLLLLSKNPEESVRHMFGELPVSMDYLLTDGNWISEDVSEQFFDCLARHGYGEAFSYEAGLFALSPACLGKLTYLLTRVISLRVLLAQSFKTIRRFNRVDPCEVLAIQNGLFHVRVSSRRETKHWSMIEQNWRGFLDGFLQLHGRATQPCEVLRTANKESEFTLRWRRRFNLSSRNGGVVFAIPALVFLLGLGVGLLEPSAGLGMIAFVALIQSTLIFWILIALRKISREDSKVLEDLMETNQARYDALHASHQKLDRRYLEANLLRGVIARITESQSTRALLQATVTEIQTSLGYRRVMVFRHQEEGNRLEIAAASGFETETIASLGGYSIDLNEVTVSDLHFGNIFKNKSAKLVIVDETYLESLSAMGRQMLTLSQTKAFVAAAISDNQTCFGLLLVDQCHEVSRHTNAPTLTPDDLHVIRNLANQLAILLSNAQKLETETRLREAFQKFVPTRVIQAMTVKTSDQNLAKLETISVLFSDIRNFTGLSDKLEADVLVKILNTYLSRMTEIVYDHLGIVDKFMGDGIMALFNPLGDCPDHNRAALKCAIAMQRALQNVNQELQQHAPKNLYWQPLAIGIGLYSGTAIVGNIGCDQKMEFTALGRTVNIAARLQELTKIHPGVIVSQEFLKEAKDMSLAYHSLGAKRIRGISREITLYQLDSGTLLSNEYPLNREKIVA